MYASNTPEIAIVISPLEGAACPMPKFIDEETAGLLVCKAIPFSMPLPPGNTRLAFEETDSPKAVGVYNDTPSHSNSNELGIARPKNPNSSETPNLSGIVFVSGETPLACKDIAPVVGSWPCSIKFNSFSS